MMIGTHGNGETHKTLCGDRISTVLGYGETVTDDPQLIDCVGCLREMDKPLPAPAPKFPGMTWI